MTAVDRPCEGDEMAISLSRPSGEEVMVEVDDLAIVLALLHLLTLDADPDDALLGVRDRESARLRADIASLQRTMPPVAGLGRPPSA
jgi:hypothetical protein